MSEFLHFALQYLSGFLSGLVWGFILTNKYFTEPARKAYRELAEMTIQHLEQQTKAFRKFAGMIDSEVFEKDEKGNIISPIQKRKD